MREIKFRGWWKADLEPVNNINERPISDLNADHLIIEQFTGLLDKNGKDIYEGDILKMPYYTCLPPEYGVEDDEGFYIGAVSFIPSKGFCIPKCLKYSDVEEENKLVKVCRYFQIRAGLEIIGNIHENGELLK